MIDFLCIFLQIMKQYLIYLFNINRKIEVSYNVINKINTDMKKLDDNIILINNVVIVKNIPENLFLILSNGFESLSIILLIKT